MSTATDADSTLQTTYSISASPAVLRALVTDATADFDEFRYADALARTEQFFWSRFTDTYIELVKNRARGDLALSCTPDAFPPRRILGRALTRTAARSLHR